MVSSHVEGADLDDWLHASRVSTWDRLRATMTHISLSSIAQVELLVHTSDDQIEYGNDISRVVFELPVQTLIMIIQVLAVDIENVLLGVVNLSQFLHVQWLLAEILSILWPHIISEETTQTILHI